MEWAPYGDLEDCVLKPLLEVEFQQIISQISLAVVIMHERRFLHRDLKPKVRFAHGPSSLLKRAQNVFLFRKPPESLEWRVKLGDFGVSKRVRDAANTSWHTSIEADCSAPEVLGLLGGDYTEESSYASPVDMWSLGYLTHWMLTKRYPLAKCALPQYCMQMRPIPLSELANKVVSGQAADFVKNLLHLLQPLG
jgi:calcium/calmodulin-dependent protein kinase I